MSLGARHITGMPSGKASLSFLFLCLWCEKIPPDATAASANNTIVNRQILFTVNIFLSLLKYEGSSGTWGPWPQGKLRIGSHAAFKVHLAVEGFFITGRLHALIRAVGLQLARVYVIAQISFEHFVFQIILE